VLNRHYDNHYKHVCALGREGIVSNRLGYRAGLSDVSIRAKRYGDRRRLRKMSVIVVLSEQVGPEGGRPAARPSLADTWPA
jgi:hypothetical protein